MKAPSGVGVPQEGGNFKAGGSRRSKALRIYKGRWKMSSEEKIIIKEYQNSILQIHACKKCGRVWDEYGEEVLDSYMKYKYKETYLTIKVMCPFCSREADVLLEN